MDRALDGLRILDLTRLLPGALASRWLAECGAEVIKIERPGPANYAEIPLPGSADFAPPPGTKRVVLNLKTDEDRNTFLSLVDDADALLESFRPGVMARFGLGYESLKARNPRLIYVAITGYGQAGPYRDFAGHDINYLAMAGLLDLLGPKDGPPCVPGVQIADIAGGSMQAVHGLLLALAARSRTGEGRFVDVSMTAGAAALMAVPLAGYRATGRALSRGEGLLGGGYACYNVYRCSDSRWVAVGALEPKFWANLCRAIGCEDLIGDQFAEAKRQRAMTERLQAIFAGRSASEWFERLGGTDCCVTPVLSIDEAVRALSPSERKT